VGADSVETLILESLTRQLKAGTGVVKRLRRESLLPDGAGNSIDDDDWADAVERLIDTGKVLEYKISDLPETLPLSCPSQSGYTTPAHLLGLLKKARPHQVEEIRDFLKESGVALPAVRTGVTAAQKKRIDNAVRKLNEIRAEVADRNPDNQVGWYLDANKNLHLMVEPDGQMEPDQQYIAHQTKLWAAGGGDW
jgi:hypothetical protein